MGPCAIALWLDSLPYSPRDAMATAAELQFHAVAINAAKGELTPQNLDRYGRKHLLHFLDDLGLGLATIGADTGFRFDNDNRIEQFIHDTQAIVDMALDLHCPILTLAVGEIPGASATPRYQTMLEVLRELGDYAANRDLRLAVSAGLGPADPMRKFLEHVRSDGVAVNYDPANFVFQGMDPLDGIKSLDEYIVAVRARDGRRYLDGSAEELDIGKGDVPYDEVMDALAEIDYEGPLVIAREPREDAEGGLRAARRFVQRYI